MTTVQTLALFHPDHEVNMQYLLDMKNAINSENFSHLFEAAGLLEKSPEDWVSAQIIIDVFNQAAERGGILDMVSIGMSILKTMAISPDFEKLDYDSKLRHFTEYYDSTHRGSNVGYFRVHAMQTQHLVYSCKNPWHDGLWYGIIYGAAKRFLPSNLSFKVYYDTQKPRREEGGEETIIHVEWWEKEAN